MTSSSSCVAINWLHSSSLRQMMSYMLSFAIPVHLAINCGRAVTPVCPVTLLIGHRANSALHRGSQSFGNWFFIARVVIVLPCQLIQAIFLAFIWRCGVRKHRTVIQQYGNVPANGRATTAEASPRGERETAGLMFLRGCGGQIYGQRFQIAA